MTVFDYVVLFVVAVSLVLGMWRGVVGEIIALVAWVLAFFAARWWGSLVAEGFTSIADPALRLVAGWVTIFVAVLVVMALLRLAVRSLLKALGMTVDRSPAGNHVRCGPGPGDRPGPGGRWRHDVATQREVVERGVLFGAA
jgi:hypothetical protein